MATYHGITKAICLNCGKITTDTSALEIMNDLDPICLACNLHLVAWHIKGEIIVTTLEENSDEESQRFLIKGE